MTRRVLIQSLPAALLASQAEQSATPARIPGRPSKQVKASPISIGFETLDRKMFDPEKCYGPMSQLGVKWARCQTGWARTEQKKGEFDFAWLDSVVDNLLAIGIQPWFNLGYGNTLYTPGPPHPSAVGWVPLNSDEARTSWLRFVEKAAERYSSKVTHWEIWNEPNIPNFWQPDQPNAAKYVELVRLTAPVIRKRIPNAQLIGGAIAGTSSLDYIEGCFEAGLGKLVDKFSYHPYRAIPEDNYVADIRAMRGIINRYRPGMPMWQGENGAPSTNNSTGALREFEWDEARQAKWLLRRLITDLSVGIEVTSYFQTVDMVDYVWSSGQSGMTNSKGVLRGREYTPKASFYALRNLCYFFDADTKQTENLLRVDKPEPDFETRALQTATFARNEKPIYTWWYPSNLQQGFPSRKARLTVWSGANQLERPVLADLLTGDVVAVKTASTGRAKAFDGLPVRDYPMLLCDASSLA